MLVSEPLVGEPVGLIECDDGTHLVRVCTREPGIIDCKGRFRRFAQPRSKLCKPAETASNCGGCSRSNRQDMVPVEQAGAVLPNLLIREFRKQRSQNSIVTVGSGPRHGQVWCGQAGATVGQFFQLERLFEYHAIMRMIAPAHFGI